MSEGNIDNEDEYTTHFKPTYIIIALDTHNSMFRGDSRPTPFKRCLKALYRLTDVLFLQPERGYSPFSVLLFNKDEKVILVDFKDNMIDTIKLLRELSELSEELLKMKYMRSCDLDLTEFLQFSKKKLKEISSTFFRRRILFITNDSNPVKEDPSKKFTALKEVETFLENEISFELIVTEENFDYELFYKEFLSLTGRNPYSILCEDEEGLLHKFISTILLRLSQRKICFFPFMDDNSKYITVIRKNYVKKDRILNNSYLSIDGTPLLRRSKKDEEGSSTSDSSYHLFNIDQKNIFPNINFNINDEELLNQRNFKVGYTLLSVCHRLTALGETIDEPSIIEEDSLEELHFFRELWQYCVNYGKVLLCAKVLKEKYSARAVELIPKFINNTKVFLEKNIPYSDEVFEPEIEESEEDFMALTERQKDVTQNIIENLTFNFQSSFLIDAAHVRKMNYIKSKLLDEDREDLQVRDILTTTEIDEKLDIDAFFECFSQERGVKRKK